MANSVEDQIVAGLANSALELAFGGEYINLDGTQSRLVRNDFVLANREEGIGAHEYRDRIGAGNLRSYVDCLAVGASRID